MLKKDCIYRLKKSDAKKYLGFTEEHFESYFKDATVAYFMLNSIKKKKRKNGKRIIYTWWFQILPEAWTSAFEHEIDEEDQELYESLFHTYKRIEDRAKFQAERFFMMNMLEISQLDNNPIKRIEEIE